ncbi:gag-pol fusion protein [Pimephales promelas]|nr:gag-pol fusion protein [Pimephales promelas]
MAPAFTSDYDKVKEVILKKYEISPETYRLRFRSLSTDTEESPTELYIRLKDLFSKWVQLDVSSKTEIMETLVLEQYMRVLYPEVRIWVKERNPSTAGEAADLVESYIAARKGSSGAFRYSGVFPEARGKSVGSGGSSFSQTKAQSFKVTDPKPSLPVVTQKMPRGDISSPKVVLKPDKEPTISVLLNGKLLTALVDTGCTRVTTNLPYPVLLGTDMPILADLVQETAWCGIVTRAQSKKYTRVAQTEDSIDGTLQDMPFFLEESLAEEGLSEEDRLDKRRKKVADLIDSSQQTKFEWEEPEIAESEFVIPSELGQLGQPLQKEDATLSECFGKVSKDATVSSLYGETFMVEQGLLYRQSEKEGSQLVVPKSQHRKVLELSHSIPWSGHMGFMKTLRRVSKRFYWPGMYTEVKEYCKTCPECQLAVGRAPAKAPLVPIPAVDAPFERIGVDIVGPVERSQKGNRFILVVCDYATRYPEAYPLRDVTAKQIAAALLNFFSHVGIPKVVLTDQGPNFMSRTLKQVYQLLGIKRVRTTPYHPQTDGLVERFNQTLKGMLKKFVSENGKDWDKWLPYLLFAYREVPQASTGFSPFELLFAHQIRGPLDVLRDSWEANDKPTKQNILSYILKMREKLQLASTQARESVQESQVKQKIWYDQKARSRTFQAGEQVLLLLPTSENRLLAKWQGPYQVRKKVGPVTYEIEMPSRNKPLQTFHINMLKKWHSPPAQPEPVRAEVKDLLVRAVQEEDEVEEQFLPVGGSEYPLNLQHLTVEQKSQLQNCIPEQLFQDTPGKTDLVQHHIYLKDVKPIRQPVYRVPERLVPIMKQELEVMQKLEVIEPSVSEWNNPIVLVPKKDGSLRFCLDFRKLNSVSKFDPYPMPRVDDLIEKLGSAQYLTILDLCKGYWQVPLSPDSKEFTAFKTPFGHYQFRVLPFGLHGAPATFQRMIDQILSGTEKYAAAYLDDIIIFSRTWQGHLIHLKEVLTRIKNAGLTIRSDKCTIAKAETCYLGHVLGHGVIRPQVGKVEAIKQAERPVTKKQVRSFLGLVGWYRRFIPNFSEKALALTELTRKNKPNKPNWTADSPETTDFVEENGFENGGYHVCTSGYSETGNDPLLASGGRPKAGGHADTGHLLMEVFMGDGAVRSHGSLPQERDHTLMEIIDKELTGSGLSGFSQGHEVIPICCCGDSNKTFGCRLPYGQGKL